MELRLSTVVKLIIFSSILINQCKFVKCEQKTEEINLEKTNNVTSNATSNDSKIPEIQSYTFKEHVMMFIMRALYFFQNYGKTRGDFTTEEVEELHERSTWEYFRLTFMMLGIIAMIFGTIFVLFIPISVFCYYYGVCRRGHCTLRYFCYHFGCFYNHPLRHLTPEERHIANTTNWERMSY